MITPGPAPRCSAPSAVTPTGAELGRQRDARSALTRHLLLAWIEHCGHRWPGTANPYLILNQQTAKVTRPVSENWMTSAFRGLTVILECRRADRQLEEALTCGPDPLHFAAVFGLDETTAIRYAAIARQLLQTPAE